MLTKPDADKLRFLVRQLVRAEVANSWKGGGDPADIPHIENKLRAAQLRLSLFITTRTQRTDTPDLTTIPPQILTLAARAIRMLSFDVRSISDCRGYHQLAIADALSEIADELRDVADTQLKANTK